MSNLTVKGNASGTGTVILEAPNTNSNRTITLPDATATLATTAQVDAVSSVVHLGTITTTSGSSASLSSLTLTGYKFLHIYANAVSASTTNVNALLNSSTIFTITRNDAAGVGNGLAIVDLGDGKFYSYNNGDGVAFVWSGASGLTTSSTSITFTTSAGNFDAGSIRIYGVK